MKLNLITNKFRDILHNTIFKMAQSDSKNYIDAEPTKDLFISMLIKDISLRDAIGDLVDNSVDGARASAKDKNNLKDFFIDITANENEFIIRDNCGGIPVITARKHAFRFGRPEEYSATPGSIGQFGIGMKRAFFKLGRIIGINSIELNSDFILNIDVDKWKSDKQWNFVFEAVNEKATNRLSNTGTTIDIKMLNKEVKNSFSDSSFLVDLGNEIALEQMLNIGKGLVININTVKLIAPKITIKTADNLKPYFYKYKFDSSLSIQVLAGISDDSAEDGGWYVFCNDRLIMGRDKSAATGWTGRVGDGVAEYHDQFYKFRGYAFFFADNVKDLPWNTTKTGMNLDSPEYKFTRSKMIDAMRMVMTLMNRLKTEKEKDNPVENQVLNNAINSIKPVLVTKLIADADELEKLNDKFEFPPVFSPAKSKEQTISYKVTNEKYAKVKDYLGAMKPAEVGLETFNYFFDNEVG
jgi:hypothetical protein